jgi:hypothetical protein
VAAASVAAAYFGASCVLTQQVWLTSMGQTPTRLH